MDKLENYKKALLRVTELSGQISNDAREFLPGIHFCPDWDDMAIYEESPEYESCNCQTINPAR